MGEYRDLSRGDPSYRPQHLQRTLQTLSPHQLSLWLSTPLSDGFGFRYSRETNSFFLRRLQGHERAVSDCGRLFQLSVGVHADLRDLRYHRIRGKDAPRGVY